MPDFEIWVLVSIAAIALLAGFVHSGIGFGFGIVAISLLPLVIDIRLSHLVISTASVPVILMAAWSYRRGADWAVLGYALLGAAAFLPLGLFAFEWVSMDWLIRGTGVAILGMVWMSYRNKRLAKQKAEGGRSNVKGFFAGAFGGFLAGAVSIAGPPVAAYALQQGWDQNKFKAFLNQFLLVVSVFKVVGLVARGFVDQSVLGLSALLAPFAILGIWLGTQASGKFSPLWFSRVVAVVLIGLAIKFLLRGIL